MDKSIPLPDQVPVMPLAGVLFPHALLPLHIFETRYRKMLELALRGHRMFCVALVKSQGTQWESPTDFFHIAGLGLIRACVERPDGTSNLILQGLRRVRLSGFEQSAPFPVARIDPLESKATSSAETDALGAKVLELYSRFKESGRQFPARMDQYLSRLDDAEMLADLMAATFINDPLRRQQVLEELTVNQRLRLVIQYLRDETGNAAV
jgi:Lon protease-like protein